MFERYTEKARRVIFFARYEASQFGSPYIETEHLLLGLLREDKALTNRFLRSHASVESIRKQIEGHTTTREKVSTSVDLPLSNECKRVLAYAADSTTLNGYVSDSKCAAKGANDKHVACAKKCLAAGEKMVVVTDGDNKVLTVDNPDALTGHEGHHVAVSGSVKGDMIPGGLWIAP